MSTGLEHVYEPIDINLLQIRETEKRPSSVLPVLFLAFVITGAGTLAWLWYSAHTHVQQLNHQIEQVETQIQTVSQQLEANASLSRVSEFIHLPEVLEEGRLTTTFALDELTRLLPRDANISSISFLPEGEINLQGFFATTETVIAFMQEVRQDPDWMLLDWSGLSKAPIGEIASQQPVDAEDPEMVMPAIQANFSLKYEPLTQEGGES